MRFLRDIGESDEDDRCRAAALEVLDALSPGVPTDIDPDDDELRLNPTAEKVLRTFTGGEEFPSDLTELGALTASNAEYLLTRLVDDLLARAHGGAPVGELRAATNRLRAVLAALSRDGTRPVAARLTDPRLLAVPDRLSAWAGSLLALVRPSDLLAATERLTARPSTRLTALRWLSRSAGRIVEVTSALTDPGRPADDPDPLHLLVTNAYPTAATRFQPEGVPAGGGAVDGATAAADPVTRTAYPLLDAPEVVAPAAEFELRVGLARSAGAGVTSPGPFTVSTEPFTLTVVLVVDGFTVLGGGSTTRTIQVSADDPYPYDVVRLRADDRAGLRAARTVLAVYSVDGQQLGIATRAVLVTTEAPEAPAAPAAPGVDWVLPAGSPRPDLEIVLADGNDDTGSVHWHFRSPHPEVGESPGFLTVRPGRDVALTARRFLDAIERGTATGNLAEQVNFVALRIGDLVPREVWQALEKAAEVVGGPPSVLLATADPHLPWELALVPAPWVAGAARLGAQAVVGRWPYTTPARTPAPPAALDAATMAVVTGRYPDAIRLEQAEIEGRALCDRYTATPVAPVRDDIVDLLRGHPQPVDLLHIALHGAFDATGTRDGILMVDGQSYLTPATVEGVLRGPVRLAFLNACQVAQGNEVLGGYAGMANALLRIGAVAVVAPLWKVDDEVARTVAEAYYPAVLEQGMSPAEFLRAQRAPDRDVRTAAESSRLAYVYFGHPLLRVTWNGVGGNA